MRVGVFGGTFDPVHLGHLAAAEEAAARLTLDLVLFVPAQQQPLKDTAPRVGNADRLEMLKLAIADNPRFGIDDIELDRPAPSYTIITLRALRQEYGATSELFFLMGVDAANMLPHWREPEEILRLARLVVMSRAHTHEPDWNILKAISPEAAHRIQSLMVPDLNISSRDLRRRIADGHPIRYQVPEPVRAYIERHRLYQ